MLTDRIRNGGRLKAESCLQLPVVAQCTFVEADVLNLLAAMSPTEHKTDKVVTVGCP
jgi:hypothetical protein